MPIAKVLQLNHFSCAINIFKVSTKIITNVEHLQLQ